MIGMGVRDLSAVQAVPVLLTTGQICTFSVIGTKWASTKRSLYGFLQMFGSTIGSVLLLAIVAYLVLQIVLVSSQTDGHTFRIWLKDFCSVQTWTNHFQYEFFEAMAYSATQFCMNNSQACCGSHAFSYENKSWFYIYTILDYFYVHILSIISEDRVDVVGDVLLVDRLLPISFIIALPKCAWGAKTNSKLTKRVLYEIVASDRENIEKGMNLQIERYEKLDMSNEDYLIQYTLPFAILFLVMVPISKMLLRKCEQRAALKSHRNKTLNSDRMRKKFPILGDSTTLTDMEPTGSKNLRPAVPKLSQAPIPSISEEVQRNMEAWALPEYQNIKPKAVHIKEFQKATKTTMRGMPFAFMTNRKNSVTDGGQNSSGLL